MKREGLESRRIDWRKMSPENREKEKEIGIRHWKQRHRFYLSWTNTFLIDFNISRTRPFGKEAHKKTLKKNLCNSSIFTQETVFLKFDSFLVTVKK